MFRYAASLHAVPGVPSPDIRHPRILSFVLFHFTYPTPAPSKMHFPLALVASALVLQASAFVVPPGISNAAISAKGKLEGLLTAQAYSYDLDCPGCPFPAVDDGDTFQGEDVENQIVRKMTPDVSDS